MAISGIINTNVSALNTINALNSTQGSLNTYLQQLSTGKSINGPANNPPATPSPSGFRRRSMA